MKPYTVCGLFKYWALLATCLLAMPFYAQDTLCFMSYNIRNARGLDGKVDFSRIAGIIASMQPQYVAIQEVDSATQRSNGCDVLSEVAALCGMRPYFAAAIPYDGGKYGVGLLTQDSPQRILRLPLPGREEARVLLLAEFDNYYFCSTHFSLTEADRKFTLAILDSLEATLNKPLLLAGDFNDTPESELMRGLSNKWQVLSDVAKPTFPASAPKSTIDYIVVNRRFASQFRVVSVDVPDEPVASDHCPVVVRLRHTPIR